VRLTNEKNSLSIFSLSYCTLCREFKAACTALVDPKHILIDIGANSMANNGPPGKTDDGPADCSGNSGR
jgi:hypothetical protein